ncbi:MAG: lycopene cyclase domain-containing protein, partial [Cyclobacteriaceae bacterium]
INGILTGSWIEGQVVWYDDEENFGIRLGTIPVEDAFYGMLLLMMNTVIWEELTPSTQPK